MTLALARRLIDAGEREARAKGLELAFAVVDAGGHPVASARMDGAPWIAPEVAFGKAWTAAAYAAPSANEGEKAKTLIAFTSAISTATHGRYTPQIGGLPVLVDGAPVGGMGASGASGAEDESVVQAALEALVS